MNWDMTVYRNIHRVTDGIPAVRTRLHHADMVLASCKVPNIH